jgi:hypothetical protein
MYKRSNHNKKEEIPAMPPMRYKFTRLTQAQTLMQIAMKTEGFYEMSANSADWIQCDVRSREFSSFGGYPAPSDRAMLATIIGDDDYYLKLTTKNHDMDYICYDAYKDEFQFWGEYECCVRAMNELRYRIHKITSRAEKKSLTQVNYAPVKYVRETTSVYCPASPSYTPHSQIKTFEFNTFVEDVKAVVGEAVEVSYSKSTTDQMSKMGFVAGGRLGLKNTGRLVPIDPFKDMGGRSECKNHYGLGFIAHVEPVEPVEPVMPVLLEESVAETETVVLPVVDSVVD